MTVPDDMFIALNESTAGATARAIVAALLRDEVSDAHTIIRTQTSKFLLTWVQESMSEEETQSELTRRLLAVGQVMLGLAQLTVGLVRSVEESGVIIDNLVDFLAYNEDLVERDNDAP